MKVLIAIDRSEGSRLAVSEVAGRLWPRGWEVRLASAVGTLDAAAREVFEPGFVGSHADDANRLLGDEAARLEAAGARVTTCVRAGRAASCIVAEACAWGARFVYLGACSRPGARGLGRTARSVWRDAPCSVGLVRPRPASSLDRPARRIVLALDGSADPLAAARSVSERPWAEGTCVDLLAPSEASAAEARALLGGLDVSRERVDAAPLDRLLEECETFGADLAVASMSDAESRLALSAVELAGCTVELIRAPGTVSVNASDAEAPPR